MICQLGMLTAESHVPFNKKKLRHLAQEFISMSEQDAGEAMDKRFGSVCFLMTRPWASAMFNEFIKKDKITNQKK